MSSRRSFLAGSASLALASASFKSAAAQMRRLIVDAQIHMWPPNRPDRPWVAGAQPQIPEPFTIERVVPMGNRVRVTIDGIAAEITPESAERLALQPGVRVIASWKATSTRILATG